MKKILLSTLACAFLLTGCGTIPKLENGEEVVAEIDGKSFTANDLYLKLKSYYGTSALVDMINTQIAEKEIETDDDARKYAKSELENIKYMYNLLRKNLDRETIDFVISLEKQVDSRDDIVTIVYDTKKDPFNIKYLISLNNRAVSYKQKLEKSKGKITNLYLKLMKQISTWNEEKYIELKDIQFNFYN